MNVHTLTSKYSVITTSNAVLHIIGRAQDLIRDMSTQVHNVEELVFL